MSKNPLLQPYDINTGQIASSAANQFTAPYVPPAGQTTGGGFLGSDGFLSKVGETALDLFGLYGSYEVQQAQIDAAKDSKNPEIQASQERAGIIPQSFPLKELMIGGGIVAGVSVLVIGAILILKD